jgi:hypothetical protein
VTTAVPEEHWREQVEPDFDAAYKAALEDHLEGDAA